jgi:uncharacterized protein YndB with AHSA1/START domain
MTAPMNQDHIAHASITIDAPAAKVWDALLNPAAIKQYLFGTTVVSDWKQGSTIVWKGEWQGKRYEDKGTVLQLEPRRKLQYTHFSPLSGIPDVPESYHTVTVQLFADGAARTRVELSQSNNPTAEAREHSEGNWRLVLGGLKQYVEQRGRE